VRAYVPGVCGYWVASFMSVIALQPGSNPKCSPPAIPR